MIRLMGILTGTAMATGLLVLAVGVPEFTATRDGDSNREDAAAPETSGQITVVEEIAEFEPVVDQDAPEVDVAEGSLPDASSAPMQASMPDTSPKPLAGVAEPEPQMERQWYAFWSPFRSQIAADGFVAQLQRTTGLDYRVIKLKPGVYEVAFAYSDDTDIQNKLTQISAATGLDLSGG